MLINNLSNVYQKNTIRRTQSTIHKLSIFLAEKSNNFSAEDIDILKNHKRIDNRRPQILENPLMI